MTVRAAGVLAAAGGVAALAVAYWAQDARGLTPCPLCLLERWPYRAVVLFGLLAAIAPRRLGRALLALAVLALAAGASVAFLHVGVEHGWWASPFAECNSNSTLGASGMLPAVPAVPCDRPVYLFPVLPLSMALMDLLYAVAFGFALAAYLGRKPRRFT